MEELEKLKAELAVYKSMLTKAYNKTESELDTLVLDDTGEVKETAFVDLVAMDAAKVKKLKTDGEGMFNKGYQKAEAEVKTKVEKVFKEKTGFNGEFETTEELFDAYVADSATKGKSKLTDDDVKKHPTYLALEKDRVPKSEFEAVKSEYETFKSNVSRNEKMSGIRSKIKSLLDTFNIEQIENPVVKNKRVDLFLKEFDEFDYELNGDTVVITDKDGKRVEDGHGNLLPFDKFVNDKAGEHFVFLKQTPKGGAGQQQQPSGTPSGSVVIKDETDYHAKMNELDIAEAKEKDPTKKMEFKKQRAELGKTWMEQNKS